MRTAFTLVELLVVIAIIGVLVGLASPGIQAMRESSRRAACQSRLIPIGMAMQSYHDRWLHFPVGTTADAGTLESVASGDHHNWIGRLMDSLDEPAIASSIHRNVSIYDPANVEVLQLSYPGVKCPSATDQSANVSHYAGLHHPTEKPIEATDHGVFILNVPIGRDDITDGLTHTMFVAEKRSFAGDLGWLSGTRASLRNVGGGVDLSGDLRAPDDSKFVGSISSFHPGGLHVLMGSGEVKFQSNQSDRRILQQLADRRDGGLPMEYQSLDSLRRQSVP